MGDKKNNYCNNNLMNTYYRLNLTRLRYSWFSVSTDFTFKPISGGKIGGGNSFRKFQKTKLEFGVCLSNCLHSVSVAYYR